MCDISMMYFPSLYFWLVSKACSWGLGEGSKVMTMGKSVSPLPPPRPTQFQAPSVDYAKACCVDTGFGGPQGLSSLRILTYFQPSVVLQLSQKMSATEWSPVSRRRCSAGPQPTLTLSQETRTQHTVGLLCQSGPQPTQKDLYLRNLPSAVHPSRINAWAFFHPMKLNCIS